MPVDHSLGLRRAAVTALRADVGLTAIVGNRVYGERVPANPQWPFVQVGVILAEPYEASCLDGMDATFAVHSFSKGPDAGGVYGMNRIIAAALNEATITFDTAHAIRLDWVSSSAVRDTDEADAWHGIAQFQTITSEDF